MEQFERRYQPCENQWSQYVSSTCESVRRELIRRRESQENRGLWGVVNTLFPPDPDHMSTILREVRRDTAIGAPLQVFFQQVGAAALPAKFPKRYERVYTVGNEWVHAVSQVLLRGDALGSQTVPEYRMAQLIGQDFGDYRRFVHQFEHWRRKNKDFLDQARTLGVEAYALGFSLARNFSPHQRSRFGDAVHQIVFPPIPPSPQEDLLGGARRYLPLQMAL